MIIDIQVFYKMSNNSLINISFANFYKDLGIDVFNIKDSFFNDICHSYSDSNNDLILLDRIKEIYQNYSICEDGCSYNKIILENKTISCNCKVKKNLNINETNLYFYQYDDLKLDSNFGIFKCFNLVFSFKDKSKNIGFWIFLFLTISYIPLYISYFYKGLSPIKEYIINEMIEFGYIQKNKENKIIENESPPKKVKNSINLNFNNSSLNKIKNFENNDINQINSKIIDNSNLSKSINVGNNKILRKNKTKKRKKKKLVIKKNLIDSDDNYFFKCKKINEAQLQTQVEEKKDNINLHKKENAFFNLINIDLNNKKYNTPSNSNYILNNYDYEEAIKYDMRSICLIFYIFLLSKQAIFHAFLFKFPLELFSLRLCNLIFIISSDLALNAIFYLDDKISEKYKYAKNIFLFAFNNNLTVILLSTLIGFIFLTLFTKLSNSTNSIREIFKKEEKKLRSKKKYIVTKNRKSEIFKEILLILKKYKIKIIILIIIEIIFMLFFWYYVTAFCHVYKKTQKSWLLDSFLSILSRVIIDCLLCLGFAKLYRIAVESNIHCLYKISLFFYSFGS